MRPQELRIKNFAGIREATVRFDDAAGMQIESDGNFPEDGRAKELILQALDWVLFWNAADGTGEKDCSVIFEFDNYGVHRKCGKEPSEDSLRLFKYASGLFCCATTVKELTAESIEETRKKIVEAIGFSDVSPLRDYVR